MKRYPHAKRRRRLVTLALALASLTLPGLDRAPNAGPVPTGIHANVVNGSISAAFPATGALLAGSDAGSAVSWCSGVLIGCSTFLTAAHCVCPGNGSSCQGARAPTGADRIVFLQHAGFFRVTSVHVHPSFAFPTADLAILKLATPVTGVAPAHINTQPPPASAPATLVGFGRTGGGSADFGLKRIGGLTTESCHNLSGATEICWSFDGSASDSCDGDSGGPLFMDLGLGPRVAGITSGGRDSRCAPGDVAFDANVYAYRDWISQVAGTDLDVSHCGGMAQAGDLEAPVTAVTGSLGDTATVARQVVQVPPGANELRIALNAVDDGQTNFDLRVKSGSPPTATDVDCQATGNGQYAYCGFRFPTPGPWHVEVARAWGTGTYQLTTTVIAGDAPVCGNGQRDTGEDCDGADDAVCPGACDANCTCVDPCTEGALVTLKAELGSRLRLRTLLHDDGGAYDGLDPRTQDLAFSVPDGPTPFTLTIPANDRGWARTNPKSGTFRWTGDGNDAHNIVLRCKHLATGDWALTLSGKAGPAPRRQPR